MPYALLCAQCSLRAFVEGRPQEVFDETVWVHLARVHPDPVRTQRERLELDRIAEALLRELFESLT